MKSGPARRRKNKMQPHTAPKVLRVTGTKKDAQTSAVRLRRPDRQRRWWRGRVTHEEPVWLLYHEESRNGDVPTWTTVSIKKEDRSSETRRPRGKRYHHAYRSVATTKIPKWERQGLGAWPQGTWRQLSCEGDRPAS
jgi:hypothetical protein